MSELIERICGVLTFDENDDTTQAALAEICESFEAQVAEEKDAVLGQVTALEEQLVEVKGELETVQSALDVSTEASTTIVLKADTLEAAIADFKVEIEDLKQRAAIGDQYLTDTREAALDSFRKIVALKLTGLGKESIAALKKQIEEGNVAFVKASQQMYSAQLEEAMPFVCPKCGTKMARRSSQEIPVDPKDDSRPIPKINIM